MRGRGLADWPHRLPEPNLLVGRRRHVPHYVPHYVPPCGACPHACTCSHASSSRRAGRRPWRRPPSGLGGDSPSQSMPRRWNQLWSLRGGAGQSRRRHRHSMMDRVNGLPCSAAARARYLPDPRPLVLHSRINLAVCSNFCFQTNNLSSRTLPGDQCYVSLYCALSFSRFYHLWPLFGGIAGPRACILNFNRTA